MHNDAPPQSLPERLGWFLVGGLLSVSLNYGPFEFLRSVAHLPEWAALAISLTIATTVFAIWNYKVNFRTGSGFGECLPRYLAALLVCTGISYLITLTGIKHWGQGKVMAFLIMFTVQTGVAGLKFVLYHKWVYPSARAAS